MDIEKEVQINRQIQPGAIFFYINLEQKNVNYQRTDQKSLYSFSRQKGFVRKAIFTRIQTPESNERFIDKEFPMIAPPNYRTVRLYELYPPNIEVPLFPINQYESSCFQSATRYNSFMAESGVVNYKYLKTLFVTQTVNARGYYQYFVKRNGEYYVEQCDDIIPVHRYTGKPIFGLELEHPYQIILFKAWVKQCGGLQNLEKAEPFSFVEAFGLPEYQVFNFRKEKKFILNEMVPQQYKRSNLNNFALNSNQLVLIGRTVNNDAVRKVGLVPNTAAYKINKIDTKDPKDGSNLYHVYSSIPVHWVGTHSAVYNSNLNLFPLSPPRRSIEDLVVDLERNFIITQTQLLTYFNKFYVVPSVMEIPSRLVVQDCYNILVKYRPVWLHVHIPQAGTLGLSIEMPKKRRQTGHYHQFRYFFTRKLTENQKSKTYARTDVMGSKVEGNFFIQSNCDKWEYYLIDYVQGYKNHSSKFAKVAPGDYVLFIHAAQLEGNIRVRFDSHVRINQPIQFQPSSKLIKQIFDSTFFSITRETSVQASFDPFSHANETIALNNSFEQLGFGTICITTLQSAKHKVAMRIYPNRLQQAGLKLPQHYNDPEILPQQYADQKISEGTQKSYVFVSAKGRPQIVILQRLNNRNRSQIGQQFPPRGAVEFFKVTPNKTFNSVGPNTLLQTALKPLTGGFQNNPNAFGTNTTYNPNVPNYRPPYNSNIPVYNSNVPVANPVYNSNIPVVNPNYNPNVPVVNPVYNSNIPVVNTTYSPVSPNLTVTQAPIVKGPNVENSVITNMYRAS